MRRLANALSALALLWAGAATVYLLQGAGSNVVTTATALGGPAGSLARVNVSLESAPGVWVVVLLSSVTFLSGLPLGVALTHPFGHRWTSWVVGCLLLAFATMAAFTVGLFYLPVALVVLAAAAASPAGEDEFFQAVGRAEGGGPAQAGRPPSSA